MTTFAHRVRKVMGHLTPNECAKQYRNESVVLASYPADDVLPENFRVETSMVGALNDGDILVETQCISIDAYLRVTMKKESADGDLHEAVKIGEKVRSLAVAKVVESRNDAFKVGDYVSGGLPVERYTVLPKEKAAFVEKIELASKDARDARHYVTYLGIATGCSAYAGAYYATKNIQPGQIAVVNAASGAVGSIVCQLYRNRGCKVIAITGGKEKQQYLLDTLKLYQCIDYKSQDIEQKLREYAPHGFDIAFDNVGGQQLDSLLKHLGEGAQIVVCGAVSQYADIDNLQGPKNYLQLVVKNASMTGFNMFAYMDRVPEIRQDLLRMMKNGSLVIKEVPVYGLQNFPVAMNKLLKGDKNGKILLYP